MRWLSTAVLGKAIGKAGQCDPYSSAARDHGVSLPDAVTYLLRRARRELEAPA